MWGAVVVLRRSCNGVVKVVSIKKTKVYTNTKSPHFFLNEDFYNSLSNQLVIVLGEIHLEWVAVDNICSVKVQQVDCVAPACKLVTQQNPQTRANTAQIL